MAMAPQPQNFQDRILRPELDRAEIDRKITMLHG